MNFPDKCALLQANAPWLLRVTADLSDLTEFLWSFERQEFRHGAIRCVRGKQMRTTEEMFHQFAAACQFPYYFGANWAAFDECLRDLEWLRGDAFLVVVFDSSYLLANEEEPQLALFLNTIDSISSEWATPVATGESWDRPAVPFHVLLHCTDAELPRLPNLIRSIPELTAAEIDETSNTSET